jgi:hypothetical protein
MKPKLFILFILSTLLSTAQPNEVISKAAFAEKIYLQLDSKVYTTDKTIWFKAVVAQASSHVPTKLSGVLYAELIGPQKKVVDKKIIKLQDGIGNGFFDLKKEYIEGQYLVRGYTEWNKNFGDDFIAQEFIRIFQYSEKAKTSPISNITIVENVDSLRRISAAFYPNLIDSTHKKELRVIISLDKKKDSLTIRKNKDGQYLLNYVIPDSSNFVGLQMQTNNKLSFSKSITLNEDYADLQFFPESGELVGGLPAKIGFKAVDYSGQGKAVEGEIVNSREKVVATFKSNPLGMGSFRLNRVDSTETYVAKIASKSGVVWKYKLPAVAARGNVISVNKDGDDIKIQASSNYLKNDSVYLRVSCRGVVYFLVKNTLKKGSRLFSVLATQLPEGIISITLLDSHAQPVAERLVFNERPEDRINISLSTNKATYLQRDPTELQIETTSNSGNPLKTNLSVLVLNKGEMGKIQDLRQNILTYFLLNSDLKGQIENPAYYFSSHIDRQTELDNLMLTQGWRRYLYTKPLDKFDFEPEERLTVSGSIGGLYAQKKMKSGVGLVLADTGKNPTFQTQNTDSLGRFKFYIDDEYGPNKNFLIQTTNKKGQQKDYTITLDEKTAPKVPLMTDNPLEKADSVVHQLVKKNVERKKLDNDFKLSSGDILLDEVVVNTYKITPQRQKVMEKWGSPKTVIEGEEILKKEEKWSYGLYSVLLFNYGDKVNIRRIGDGYLYAFVNNEITLVVVDGIPVNYLDFPLIQSIPTSEVKSFEIIEYAKDFLNLYMEVFPQASPMDAPTEGNVIAIYTYGGNGLFGVRPTIGIAKTSIPVFSERKEFYSPKYENIQPEDWYKPDLRALVHWQPQLITDSSGKAKTSFYNADNLGEMQVVVEAISENGKIGYGELLYEVAKNPKNKQTIGLSSIYK